MIPGVVSGSNNSSLPLPPPPDSCFFLSESIPSKKVHSPFAPLGGELSAKKKIMVLSSFSVNDPYGNLPIKMQKLLNQPSCLLLPPFPLPNYEYAILHFSPSLLSPLNIMFLPKFIRGAFVLSVRSTDSFCITEASSVFILVPARESSKHIPESFPSAFSETIPAVLSLLPLPITNTAHANRVHFCVFL